MSFKFEWNPYADQPHNVAPRSERRKHHIRHAGTYLSLIASNLRRIAPGFRLYRKLWKEMYRQTARITDAFGVSVSPFPGRNDEVIAHLKETGVRSTLVRIPSWERDKLARFTPFIEQLYREGFALVLALLQNREDVENPRRWQDFLKDVFSRLSPYCSFFEIGHAWNRTKWGVWDYCEYLDLARPAVPLAQEFGVKLVGPAVIDFEFHLYPPTLAAIPFDKVSSLLYVDHFGAPENTQAGFSTAKKVALLKASIETSRPKDSRIWITEVNWPLKGTYPYSPASGKPNVTEDEQASYLVRYHAICLASGYVERIYWWQLVAPGYGLIDSRNAAWRKRPAFDALKTTVRWLEASFFLEKVRTPAAEIYMFRKERDSFALGWTRGNPVAYQFPLAVSRVLNRDGRDEAFRPGNPIILEGSPKYVFFS